MAKIQLKDLKPIWYNEQLYVGVHKETQRLLLFTLDLTEKSVWRKLKEHHSWRSCFDMEFSPTKKELQKDYRVIRVKLIED